MPVVTCSDNTTVGRLSREFGRLLWHFLTHGGEMNVEGDSALHEKLVVRVRDIIAGESKTE